MMPALLTVLLFLFLDAVCRVLWSPTISSTSSGYLEALLFSCILWGTLAFVRNMLPRVGQWLIAAGVACFVPTIVLANFVLYREVGEYFTFSWLTPITDEPSLGIDYFVGWASWPLLLTFLLLVLASFGMWRPRTGAAVSVRKGRSVLLCGLFLSILLGLQYRQVGKQVTGQYQLPDGAFFSALTRAIRHPAKRSLYRSSLPDHIDASSTPAAFDIVLIINESWGKPHLSFYGYGEETMPFLSQWLAQETENFFPFRRAYTNSNSSDLSVPSLLTGVGPWESNRRLARIPLVWDWAHAARLNTFFVTPSSFRWANLSRFMLQNGPQKSFSRHELAGKIVNSLGIDELIATDKMANLITQSQADDHFLAVYYSNATHVPYQGDSRLLSQQPTTDHRYDRALFILDQAFSRIYSAVRASGRLDTTVFFIASDHGQFHEQQRRVTRLSSYYEEIFQIPLLIRVPPSWLEHYPERIRNLKVNADCLVSNLDLIPTIVDSLGLLHTRQNREIMSELDGDSLLQPLPCDRIIRGTSFNAVRQWPQAGFGIARGDLRFVFSTLEGLQAFDLSIDSQQKQNILESLPVKERQFFEDIIEQTPYFSDMLQRGGYLDE